MTLLYLVRHGAVEWPEPGCYIGQTDARLSAEGRLQAEACRNELKRVEFSGVWSSDLSRATETAGILFPDCSAYLRTCRELREIDLGEWEGVPRQRVKESRPDLWRARGENLADFRPPEGESFRDLQQRVVPQVLRIIAQRPSKACIVTHAGVIRVLICHFLHVPLSNLFRIRIDYGSVSMVSCSSRRFEVCALNLRPSNLKHFRSAEIGGRHDPAQV
jgi:probable phosphoglycerate mutase